MSRSPGGVVLRPDLTALQRHPGVYGVDDDARVRRLAAALASGPTWDRIGARLRVVVRTTPVPLIGVLGAPGDDDAAMLDALGWQVQDCLDRLLPVDWSRASALVEDLAGRLAEALGPRLDDASLVGIPRGGVVVAGLLSYVIDRPVIGPGQQPEGGLLIAVDDCAISGTRVARWLAGQCAAPTVVALLCAHPVLRTAVAAQAGVIGCVSALDLRDHAPAKHGADHDAWVTRWRARSPHDLWTGHPDHVVFPWNEPDLLIWDDRAGAVELGWRVVPPEWCLKNRSHRAAPQRCSWPAGPVQPGAEVLWATFDDEVVIADAASGQMIALVGVGADMWSALAATADLQAAAEQVATRYEVEAARVEGDLEELVRQCRQAGFLAP